MHCVSEIPSDQKWLLRTSYCWSTQLTALSKLSHRVLTCFTIYLYTVLQNEQYSPRLAFLFVLLSNQKKMSMTKFSTLNPDIYNYNVKNCKISLSKNYSVAYFFKCISSLSCHVMHDVTGAPHHICCRVLLHDPGLDWISTAHINRGVIQTYSYTVAPQDIMDVKNSLHFGRGSCCCRLRGHAHVEELYRNNSSISVENLDSQWVNFFDPWIIGPI